MLLATAAVLSPVGLDVIRTANNSGEQLSRSIAWALIYVYGGGFLALIVVEWLARWWLAWRKRRRAA
jgi:hypothetical protein